MVHEHHNNVTLQRLVPTLTIIVVLIVVIMGVVFWKVNQEAKPMIKTSPKTKAQIQALQESNNELRAILGLPDVVQRDRGGI